MLSTLQHFAKDFPGAWRILLRYKFSFLQSCTACFALIMRAGCTQLTEPVRTCAPGVFYCVLVRMHQNIISMLASRMMPCVKCPVFDGTTCNSVSGQHVQPVCCIIHYYLRFCMTSPMTLPRLL
jgi:hypothetical protein